MKEELILSLDVESDGLHGQGFAVGAVVLDMAGKEQDRFQARCPHPEPLDPWVVRFVLPALARGGLEVTHPTARAMRDAFWSWYLPYRTEKMLILADCGLFVEGRFMAACVDDDPKVREFQGPYPMHDVASFLTAAGMDPMVKYAAMLLPNEPVNEHHPVYDALVSAHCALFALRATGALSQPQARGRFGKTLCLDFDGVLHEYRSGWRGADVIGDPPVEGALPFLEEMTKHFDVCIFSSRNVQNGGIAAMRLWLLKYGLPREVLDVITFPKEKPAAHLTLDDRAMMFKGIWPSVAEIREFAPWNRR